MKGKRRGIDFIIISFSRRQQSYPLRGEVSESVPRLQTHTASSRTVTKNTVLRYEGGR